MAANSFAASDHIRRMAQTLALGWFVAFAVFLTLLGGIAWFGRPSDGDPIARIELAARPAKHVQRAANTVRPRPPAPAAQAPAAPAAPATPVPPQVVPQNVEKPVVVGKSLVADPALIEQTPQGPLPRIAIDGRMPMTAYAPPIPAAKGPRIAIVVGDLGISAKATAAAIEGLPSGVTLAFAPYEDDVGRWAGEARRTGHEVLLEVPMEPFDFPDSDPGPHTLRAAVGEESNNERLVWSLTRFTGYAGITNFLGGRFLSDADSLEPVMTFVARRGLLFFDSSPQGKSVAPDVAKRINAPYVQSALAIDTIQTGMEIDARLSELEQLARANGSASGTASVSPVAIERIANWAKGLEGRGFVLVPASAIVAPPK
jgi:uncharacterized protein